MTFQAQEYLRKQTTLPKEVALCKSAVRLDRLVLQLEEGIKYCKNELQEKDLKTPESHEYLIALYTLTEARSNIKYS